YACKGDVCGASPCSSDDDCADKFRCDSAKKDCVPLDTTVCSADGKTQSNPDGTVTECAPYICSGTTCKDACTSVDDCQSPNVCDTDGKCKQAPAASKPSSDGGCSVPAGGSSGDAAWVFAGLAAAWLARRRRATSA